MTNIQLVPCYVSVWVSLALGVFLGYIITYYMMKRKSEGENERIKQNL